MDGSIEEILEKERLPNTYSESHLLLSSIIYSGVEFVKRSNNELLDLEFSWSPKVARLEEIKERSKNSLSSV
jgi:hypothetical protein